VRIAAAEALGELDSRDEAVIRDLREMLNDSRDKVVCQALSTLCKLLGKDAMSDLRKGLYHESAKIRRYSIAVLCDLQSKTADLLPGMDEVVARHRAADLRRIADAMLASGPDGRSELRRIMMSDEKTTVERVARALGATETARDEAIAVLRAVVKSKSTDTQCCAIRALGQIGPRANDAVPDLIAAMRSENNSVRCEAADALGQIGPAAKAAILDLIREVRRDSGYSRCKALESLGRIGSAAPKQVLPVLVEGLEAKDLNMRSAAARALGHMGPAAKEAVELLRRKAADTSSRISIESERALRKIETSSEEQ
jgi:HEAT repeat protein